MDAAPVNQLIVAEAVNNQFGGLSLEESNANNVPVNHSGPSLASEVGKTSPGDEVPQKADLNLENFTVDESSCCRAQIRASFYPKFENEKTDQEIETTRLLSQVTPATPEPAVQEAVQKNQGLIVFFPGTPGNAKSSLCKELVNTPGGLGDDRPVHTLMGDLVKGDYWEKVADELRKKPQSIMLADKNARDEDVWRQIEDMCRRNRVTGVPVISDSEGTESNPYSLDALAVFMFRVLHRVDHPRNLDKTSAKVGNVLLMFYHLYEGKNREEFEGGFIERFGSLVKMPLLRSDRSPLPDPVKSTLEEGIDLFQLHSRRHGRRT